MAFASPGPTAEELAAYYAGYPVHAGVSPITLKRYDALLDAFEPYRRTNKLIDVGCGAGTFLERAAARGWEVHGTEFGRIPIETCRAKGIAVEEGALDPDRYAPGSFDVVTSFEVIEHVMDPGDELRRMHQVLRPGGLLYLTTPNYRCVGHWMAGADWSVVNYPEHLSLFTPRTMKRLLRQRNFAPMRIRTTGIDLMRIRYRKDQGCTGRRPIADSQEDLRKRMEGSAWLRLAKRAVDSTLSLLGIGDHLKAWAVKPLNGDRAGD